MPPEEQKIERKIENKSNESSFLATNMFACLNRVQIFVSKCTFWCSKKVLYKLFFESF